MTEIVPLDYRKLSYKPLFLDYLHRYDALSPFFPGDPFHPDSFRRIAKELDARHHPRVETGAALKKLNRDLGADDAALESIRSLTEGALAIVTGQQVGILGGPLYTLYKALTSVHLARDDSSLLDRPVVPLFWMDADDHDFDEVRHAYLLDASNDLLHLQYEVSDNESRVPVGTRRLGPGIETVLQTASQALPASEFKEDLWKVVEECYAPGRSLSEAFGSLLLHLTRSTGLVVVDPSIPELKRLAVDLFQREMREGSTSSELVRKVTERLVAAGYHAQAAPAPAHLNLFYAKPQRHPVTLDGSRVRLSADGAVVSREEAERLLVEEPECFSPNVLLRPLYQDTILPTLSYVAGPNELAYFAQLGEVYSHFGVTMPLISPRSSLTVVERAQSRFLERYGVDLRRLSSNDESLLNEILRQHSPPQLEEDLTRARACIQEITAALERDLDSVDPTLVPTVASTRGKLLHHLKELETKALRAVKRKNETVRNQFLATRTALFPGFDMQERKLSPVVFLNKYGRHFPEMVEERADPAQKAHLLLYP
ncbi:MAG: bacillithiol biosynthesis cysteine-adding enzyme BshC [Vicinamibacteria bacterium]